MKNNTFIYSYSASQQSEVEAIRKKYLPAETDKMERLRRLDDKVQNAGVIESLCLGIIGVLIFGIAMCFALGVFGSAWWSAIPVGIVGMAAMFPAYPLYKHLHNKKKEALTPEILALSEELIEK